MDEQETLTLSVTIVVKPEPNLTAEDKEAFFRDLVSAQVSSWWMSYDWGLSVTGSLESTTAETVVFDNTQPDYTE